MKKIAIVTLNGYFNYGNRLQNYALQETLKSLGFEIETIMNTNKTLYSSNVTFMERVNNLKNKSKKEIYGILEYKVWRKVNKYETQKSEEIRTEVFKKFTHNHIKETDYSISDNSMPEDLSLRYDYFVAGSDQVWNPNYIHGSPINFLIFAEQHKRIAYAPSFGVSEVKAEYIKNYKEWISGMHKLSVREDDGAKIIKDLTGRDAPVLVDPTLLITKEKWISISKEAANKKHF